MIKYKSDIIPATEDIIDLYISSGIKRPVNNPDRITKMHMEAQLIVTAWNGNVLVGIARSLTDFCYSTYLADLAVRKEYQKNGIGKKLIQRTQEIISKDSMLLLIAAPSAEGYYPHVGFEPADEAFIIKRRPY